MKEYICPKCLQDYYNKVTLREHYYQEHLKQHLYKCKKCGKGFHFKSKRSYHKSSCPNKEEPDKFDDIVRDPELEKLFVKKVIMKNISSEAQPNQPLITDMLTNPVLPTPQQAPQQTPQQSAVTPQPMEQTTSDTSKETDDQENNLNTLAMAAEKEERMDLQ